MIKWLFKSVFRLFITLVALAVVAIIVLLLSYNSILRVTMEHQIRARTGMDAEIGKFSLGLIEPTLEIKDLKIYNPPSFGGTLFLDIPEIHAEFDRAALLRHEIHFTLLRLNLGEFDIVKNQAGQTNIFSLGLALPSKKSGNGKTTSANIFQKTQFPHIDVLNISIGTAKYVDLKDQRNNHERNIGIENCIIPNVKSEADLGGLELLIGLRGGPFFKSLADPKSPAFDILNMLGQ
ncbi:MAG TPA: hypothetical protein VGH42_07310 [Verrucomicrobiae bacterium]|jgi:uncharacterized protein involved in outer membrane biogenesis